MNSHSQEKVQGVEVLSVEDNPADVALIREMFDSCSFDVNLSFVNDGSEALDYLFRRGNYQNAERPQLVLLDLNLPKENGYAVLEQVKKDPVLKTIPVLILSSSSNHNDIVKSYRLNANSFITKPSNWSDFENAVKTLAEFWFKVSTLPVAPIASN